MIDREDIVAAVIDAAGGELTGRVRLQKVVYLLDQLGLGSGFEYDYHHYGPYSRDLDNATADAQAFDLIDETFRHRGSDGARYSVFKLKADQGAKPEAFGRLGRDRAEPLLRKFSTTNVTVLELAATIVWLCREEKIANWRDELIKRKSVKVQNGRLDRAVDLLRELGLSPPTATAA
jgi:uncharacterized protein YwgA